MFKKTITYTDFDGEEVTETFYFNLTQAEATEFNYKMIGDRQIDNYVRAITEAKDYGELVSIFKELILFSYGEKVGGRFLKVKDGVRLADYFASTEAYSKLFVELATNDQFAAEFVNGITPKDAPKVTPPATK